MRGGWQLERQQQQQWLGAGAVEEQAGGTVAVAAAARSTPVVATATASARRVRWAPVLRCRMHQVEVPVAEQQAKQQAWQATSGTHTAPLTLLDERGRGCVVVEYSQPLKCD